MQAEYLPAAVNKVRPDTTGCNVNLKICDYNIRRDESEMIGINEYQDHSSCSIKKETVFSDVSKKSAGDDLLLSSDEECCAENYCDLSIPPEEELSKIMAYLRTAKQESSDVSGLLSLLEIAECKYKTCDTGCFYEAVDSFYAVYEILCRGKGGSLYASGDYLAFTPETPGYSLKDLYF